MLIGFPSLFCFPGMSTIPEVLAARHCGMKILGLSLITNKVLSGEDTGKTEELHATHEEVLGAVKESGMRVESLVRVSTPLFFAPVLFLSMLS